MAHKWKNGQKVEVKPPIKASAIEWTPPPDGEPRRKYIKARQCATVFKKSGRRCTWYAVQDELYCRRHRKRNRPPMSDDHRKKLQEGRATWIARVRALEEKQPGVMAAIFGGEAKSAAVKERWRKQREAGIKSKSLVKMEDPTRPKTKDKFILQAHKEISRELARLPAVPDKPFDDLEPHEQLTVITGQSLKVVHQILQFPMVDESGAVNPKVASMVKDTALRALAVRVKVDRNVLTARKLDKMTDIIRRLKKNKDADDDSGSGSPPTVIEG